MSGGAIVFAGFLIGTVLYVGLWWLALKVSDRRERKT